MRSCPVVARHAAVWCCIGNASSAMAPRNASFFVGGCACPKPPTPSRHPLHRSWLRSRSDYSAQLGFKRYAREIGAARLIRALLLPSTRCCLIVQSHEHKVEKKRVQASESLGLSAGFGVLQDLSIRFQGMVFASMWLIAFFFACLRGRKSTMWHKRCSQSAQGN